MTGNHIIYSVEPFESIAQMSSYIFLTSKVFKDLALDVVAASQEAWFAGTSQANTSSMCSSILVVCRSLIVSTTSAKEGPDL